MTRSIHKIDKCDFCTKKAEYVIIHGFWGTQLNLLCEDHRYMFSKGKTAYR